MSCKLMLAINNDFSHLEEYDRERIRSIVCGASCGGKCCDEYIVKSEKYFNEKIKHGEDIGLDDIYEN